MLRLVMPRHGFGRHELLPVRACRDAIARYLGKYLVKGAWCRDERFKGARWVRYSRGWRTAYSTFAWNSPGSWCYRRKLALLADALRLGYEDLRERFGPKWAYLLADIIHEVQQDEYATPAHAFADGVDEDAFDGVGVPLENICRIRGIKIRDRLTAREAAGVVLSFAPYARDR